MMDKIKDLLAKSGCKPELVQSIVESLESYKTGVRSSLNEDFNRKVESWKRTCINETEAHKRELARRLQVFCETKSAAIEAQSLKMSAVSESKANAKLKNVKALLEGVELNSTGDGRSAAAIERQKRQIKQLQEKCDRAVAEANRKTAIAEKALKANRNLVIENENLKNKTVMMESKKATNPTVTVRRSKPVTTRPTLVESQDRKPRQQKISGTVARPAGGFSVLDIAATMDEDLI